MEQVVRPSNDILHSIWLRILIYSLLLILIAFLGLYNQPYYPTTWLDEGFALQGAINLVRHGQYAMLSTEGFRVFDQPLLANGPGIVLPISAAFAVFGIGLLQARLVMVLFLLVSLIAFFRLSKQLYGLIPAFISSFILLALPAEGLLLLGRQALGMIPSLAYFLVGYLLFLKAIKSGNVIYNLGTAFFFAAAVLTKGQYMLLIPMLLLTAVLDVFIYKSAVYKKILVILLFLLAFVAAWYLIQLLTLGLEDFLRNMASLRSSSKVTVSAFRMERIPGNLMYLARSGILFVVLPGWLYILWKMRKPKTEHINQLLLMIFVPVWLAWFVFVSVGWHRYAFDPYAIGAIFAGKFIWDFFPKTNQTDNSSKSPRPTGTLQRGLTILSVSIVLLCSLAFVKQLKQIISEPDSSPQDFARYISNSLQSGSVIESWEWEIDLLAPGFRYHHPTNDWVDKATAILQFGDEIELDYDVTVSNPEYLINGPFSKWTGLYVKPLESGCCTLIQGIGSYDLYKFNDR